MGKPNDIVFDDLGDPKLTFLKKLALGGALRTTVDPRWALDYWTDRIEALLKACVRDRHV